MTPTQPEADRKAASLIAEVLIIGRASRWSSQQQAEAVIAHLTSRGFCVIERALVDRVVAALDRVEDYDGDDNLDDLAARLRRQAAGGGEA